MAAGLSIEEKNIEEFRRRLNVNCTLTDEELRPKIVIDVPMPVSYITKELVEQIHDLEFLLEAYRSGRIAERL